MPTALVLAAHGSHITAQTAGTVWNIVDALRRRGIADEITATFYKEQPEFSQVLHTLDADQVVVIPLFTASGYFSQRIIPRDMALESVVTRRDSRTVYLTRSLGEHPAITEIILQRIHTVMRQFALETQETTVVVIGHGTRRSKSTADTAQTQVAAIQQSGLVASAVDAYLEVAPTIATLFERTRQPHVIAVPFFVASGAHATMDVPSALGIQYGDFPAQSNGRMIYYTATIGEDDAILDVITEMVRETGVTIGASAVASPWDGLPRGGSAELIAALRERESLRFGQLLLTKTKVAPVESTRHYRFDSPADLRRHLRETPFRPLASSVDLPADWWVEADSLQHIPAIVETVYPGALSDWAGRGEVMPPVFDRAEVATATVRQNISEVCNDCIKRPIWYDALPSTTSIPCKRPCDWFMSHLTEHK